MPDAQRENGRPGRPPLCVFAPAPARVRVRREFWRRSPEVLHITSKERRPGSVIVLPVSKSPRTRRTAMSTMAQRVPRIFPLFASVVALTAIAGSAAFVSSGAYSSGACFGDRAPRLPGPQQLHPAVRRAVRPSLPMSASAVATCVADRAICALIHAGTAPRSVRCRGGRHRTAGARPPRRLRRTAA